MNAATSVSAAASRSVPPGGSREICGDLEELAARGDPVPPVWRSGDIGELVRGLGAQPHPGLDDRVGDDLVRQLTGELDDARQAGCRAREVALAGADGDGVLATDHLSR